MERIRSESAVSWLLTAAALTMAAVMVRREFWPSTREFPQPRHSPKFLSEWQALLRAGHTSGDSLASAKLIEFVDLECPACRSFNRTVLRQVQAEFGSRLSITYIHFPLSIHRFANIAAQGAECAGEQGRFVPFLDLTYEHQDSLGLKSWSSFASEAGVLDTVRFLRCIRDSRPNPAIDSGLVLAKRLRLEGTPTLVLNGWLYPLPPSTADLSQAIKTILAGGNPFDPVASTGDKRTAR
jgi:Thioredoxin